MDNRQQIQTIADDELVAKIVQTLDQSALDLDELSLQRLKNARVHALAQAPTKLRSKWMAMSLAASIVALLLIPVAWHQHNVALNAETEMASQDIPPTAQELDDMDMLMAMEDVDA